MMIHNRPSLDTRDARDVLCYMTLKVWDSGGRIWRGFSPSRRIRWVRYLVMNRGVAKEH